MKSRLTHVRKAVLALPFFAASLTTLPAFSQTTPAQAAPQLPDTVVTATRMPTRADELVSDVVVVNRTTIEANSARSLPELLARTAGVQVAVTGGNGKLSSVFIRGSETRHTILLIDGVRYGSATAGTPIWDNIPVEMIDHIEVLKGPASALYGSEGAGGVVQIFTRKGQTGFHPFAAVTLGEKGFQQLSGGLRGGQGPVRYAINLQTQRETGFSSTNAKVLFNNFNPDEDGFKQTAASATLSYDFNPDWRADASLLQSNGTTQVDDGLNRDARSKLRTTVAQLGMKGRILSAWQTELRVQQGTDLNEAIVGANFPSRFKSTQNQVTWQNNITTPLGVVLAGAEQLVQKVDSSTNYLVKKRTINALFLGLNGSYQGHSWQINARNDQNTQFGTSNTGFVGYGYKFNDHWRVSASQGTSFVAPSFNQLYFPGFSNTLLQPERGNNTDMSVVFTSGRHQTKLTRFDNKIRGYITNTTLPANIPRARIDGWSLNYQGGFDKLTVSANLDTLRPLNELTQKVLARRAKLHASFSADYDFGRYSAGTTVLKVGSRFDDTANTPAQTLQSYTTVDAHVDIKLAKDWAAQAKINNLTGKVYETAYGYNQPGRQAFLTLRYEMK